jgi:uncharacterized protein
MKSHDVNRREFLKTALAGIALSPGVLSRQTAQEGGVPKRPLGSTGENVSIIGIGGWDIGNVERRLSVALMQEAIDEGVTFFDNSWDYHAGGSEDFMGEALVGENRRDRVFLMSKVCARDYEGALRHLDDSLRRLRTDHLDLWQFHGIKWADDPELIFAENGALRAALEARAQGKVRFIGFTGHQDPDFHLAMLEQPFDWDTVQMPVNVLDANYRSFQKRVMPVCVERGIGVIGMKGLAAQGGIIARELGIDAGTARRYALSLPIATLVCGIQSREDLLQDLAIARGFEPMGVDDLTALAARLSPRSEEGQHEAYKTGNYGCDWHHNQG